jgi:predicted nucleic acid-binding Zn ribbon protein
MQERNHTVIDAKPGDILEIERWGIPNNTYYIRVHTVTDKEITVGMGRQSYDRQTGIEIKRGRNYGYPDKILRVMPTQNCTVCGQPVPADALLVVCCDEHRREHLQQEHDRKRVS